MNSTLSEPDQADPTFETGDSDQPIPPNDVIAYNELRSCADLVRMHTSNKLEIQPDFQREVVWELPEQTRFIDSLVKQLPIPSMCFSLDYKSQKWKVIDGLQRMSTIIKFLGSKEWRLSDEKDVDPRLCNASNEQLRSGSEEQQRIYSQVEEVSIPITVIRCDYSKPAHMRYLFTIFYRLNSGGVRLTNQEIRNCIYSGSFNDFLKSTDRDDVNWQNVKQRIWGKMDRFRSIEVLLRALAFDQKLVSYDGNLAAFLNTFMHEKMTESQTALLATKSRLLPAIEMTEHALSGLSKGKRSLTLIEALLVGFLGANERLSNDAIKRKTSDLITDPLFSDASKYAISGETNVKDRLNRAIQILRK
jgi:hypothetical protein